MDLKTSPVIAFELKSPHNLTLTLESSEHHQRNFALSALQQGAPRGFFAVNFQGNDVLTANDKLQMAAAPPQITEAKAANVHEVALPAIFNEDAVTFSNDNHNWHITDLTTDQKIMFNRNGHSGTTLQLTINHQYNSTLDALPGAAPSSFVNISFKGMLHSLIIVNRCCQILRCKLISLKLLTHYK